MVRILVVFLATLAVTLAQSAPLPEDAIPFHVPTAVGTRWVYRHQRLDWGVTATISSAVSKTDSRRIESRYRTPDGEDDCWEELSVSKGGLHLYAQGRFVHPEPICWLRLPVQVGARWRVDSSYTMPGNSTHPVVGWIECKGYEQVDVPAGLFRAVRLEGKGRMGSEAWSEIRWYASGVGEVKRHDCFNNRFELVSFKLGPRMSNK